MGNTSLLYRAFGWTFNPKRKSWVPTQSAQARSCPLLTGLSRWDFFDQIDAGIRSGFGAVDGRQPAQQQGLPWHGAPFPSHRQGRHAHRRHPAGATRPETTLPLCYQVFHDEALPLFAPNLWLEMRLTLFLHRRGEASTCKYRVF